MPGLLKLVDSSKATGVFLVVVALTVLCALGRIEGQETIDALKVIVAAWLGAHAVQSGAEAIARRPSADDDGPTRH